MAKRVVRIEAGCHCNRREAIQLISECTVTGKSNSSLGFASAAASLRPMKKFALGLGLLTLASSAAADMSQTQPGRYLCNTSAGTYKQQDILPLQPGQEMRLSFRLVEEHFSERWTVLAAVYFRGSNGKSRIAVGKARNDRTRMYVSVSTPGNEAQDVIFQYPVTSDWLVLNLNLNSRGVLTLSSGKLKQRYKWGAVSRTFLHCNSGNWEFDVWPQSYAPAIGAPRPPASAN